MKFQSSVSVRPLIEFSLFKNNNVGPKEMFNLELYTRKMGEGKIVISQHIIKHKTVYIENGVTNKELFERRHVLVRTSPKELIFLLKD